MAIEWVAISAVVGAYLRKYAAERAEKLATRYADGVFAKTYRRLVPDAKLVQANEAFVTRFGKELDSAMDLPTLLAEGYQEALKLFLSNPSVQDALVAPLDGQSELNWEVLRGTWAELRLIELPGDFDWAKVARTYRESIKRLMLADPDLRPVIEAVASLRSAAALERLAGPARAFDLARYAGALKTAHGYLKLGPLDPDWTQYEGRVRLESVYVPQSVKQALPPRDLTRDYLRSLKEESLGAGLRRAPSLQKL